MTAASLIDYWEFRAAVMVVALMLPWVLFGGKQ